MGNRIDYNEEMVGNAHPTKSDTLNRLINVFTTIGDIIYATAAATVTRLAKGTASQGLIMNAGATAPIWAEILPWWIDFDVFMTDKANVNWATLTLDPLHIHGADKGSSGAQNDSISWDVILAAGTWNIQIMHLTTNNMGIYSVQFDSVEKGTIDGYSVGSVYNVRNSVTGIVVAATAKIELKLKMATKNGASASYYGRIQSLRLIRTA